MILDEIDWIINVRCSHGGCNDVCMHMQTHWKQGSSPGGTCTRHFVCSIICDKRTVTMKTLVMTRSLIPMQLDMEGTIRRAWRGWWLRRCAL